MKKRIAYGVSLLVVMILITGAAVFLNYTPKPASGGGVPMPQIIYSSATVADFIRFEDIARQNEIIQKLPEDAKISLSFYNFDNGGREWDGDYLLTRGNVQKIKDNNVDIKMIMHSKYLSQLNANNFCFIIQDARRRGDFESELLISKTNALWKYKSIMSYKSCLGL